MRKQSVTRLLASALILFAGLPVLNAAQAKTGSQDEKAAIQAVLTAQVAAWNRGDIPGFMETYENSPETTFIGANINMGFAPILERYKRAYTTKEQMGTLTFHHLDIRLLPNFTGATEYAVAIGHFHLARTTKGEAKKDDGIFSLVWHKGAQGWKILLDHTS